MKRQGNSNKGQMIIVLALFLQSTGIIEAFISTPFSFKCSLSNQPRIPHKLQSTEQDKKEENFDEKEAKEQFEQIELFNKPTRDLTGHNQLTDIQLDVRIPPHSTPPPKKALSNTEKAYSIDDEISLQEFVRHINEIDRGIHESPNTYPEANIIERLFEKSLDTIEDASLMYRRSFTKYPSSDANALSEWYNDTLNHKPRVLVIGSGWASHAFIKCIDTELFRVLVVSPTNYFVFTPMLASSSVGTTEVRSIVESIRESNPTVKFLEGKGVDINARGKTVRVALGPGDIVQNDFDDNEKEIVEVPYDVMVYSAGVGPISSSKRIPGLSPQHVYFLKTVKDAQRLRTAVIDLLEKASQPHLSEQERRQLLTFVVTGGGPTGVEYTGELTDFLNDVTGSKLSRSGRQQSVAPFAPLAKYLSIKLVHGGTELLPMFDDHLRESAKQTLEKAGVEVMTGTKVDQVMGKDLLVVVDEHGNKRSISCGIIVWAAGTKPVQLTEKLIFNLDDTCSHNGLQPISSLSDKGRIPVDQWQRVLGAPEGSILAIGDASGTTGDDGMRPLPQTAQVAAQQGAYIARMLNRGYDLEGAAHSSDTDIITRETTLFLPPPISHEALKDRKIKLKLRGQVTAKPFQFLNLGQLAYTGGGEALSQVELGSNKLFSRAGSVGYLLWKSVYVVKQVSTKSRVLVIFDWCKTKIFGRDVTRN